MKIRLPFMEGLVVRTTKEVIDIDGMKEDFTEVSNRIFESYETSEENIPDTPTRMRMRRLAQTGLYSKDSAERLLRLTRTFLPKLIALLKALDTIYKLYNDKKPIKGLPEIIRVLAALEALLLGASAYSSVTRELTKDSQHHSKLV